MGYEAVIGLETHVQLQTKSKMFCSCDADYRDAEPNSLTCPTCLGLPGALPVVNQRAVEYAILIGAALNCHIATETKFDRKNYNYPDLPKGYQISQYDQPICYDGYMELETDPPHKVRIERVHMEEDVAKLVHQERNVLLDFNRSGMPLMEVVTKPDFRTTAQVADYIEQLQSIVRFLGVGRANMEEGTFRCDANISIRPQGAEGLGTKVEIKNMNRIGAVEKALNYEIKRQIELAEKGQEIVLETRGWNDQKQITQPQRRKEQVSDYRYFPEPDLPKIKISQDEIATIQKSMPELPRQWRQRIADAYKLNDYDTRLLTSSADKATFFTDTVKHAPESDDEAFKIFAKQAANWINGELAHLMNDAKQDSFAKLRVETKQLAALINKVIVRDLNNSNAKKVLATLFKSGGETERILTAADMGAISADVLKNAVAKVLQTNTKAVDELKEGKTQVASFLVGQVMRETKGKADATEVRKVIGDELGLASSVES